MQQTKRQVQTADEPRPGAVELTRMLCPRTFLVPARAVLLLVVAIAMTGGCDPSRFETSACNETQLRTAPAQDLSRLTATLVDSEGTGLPERPVTLAAVRSESDGGGRGLGVTTTTDGNGVATLDLEAVMRDDSYIAAQVNQATRLVWFYENPDRFNAEARPNYCSSEAVVELRDVRR